MKPILLIKNLPTLLEIFSRNNTVTKHLSMYKQINFILPDYYAFGYLNVVLSFDTFH